MPAPARNIVELKRALAEQFPGVKMNAGERRARVQRWPTGVDRLDSLLGGGLSKSAITEWVSVGVGTGSSLLIAALIQQAHRAGEWLALIDGSDGFDPAGMADLDLQRLLWIRCSNARQAIKAADLVLHDGTSGVAVLDLAFCAPRDLRRIPSSAWFRLERLAENIATALLVITPEATISNAETRLRLKTGFSLEALDQAREMLCAQIAPEGLKKSERIVKTA